MLSCKSQMARNILCKAAQVLKSGLVASPSVVRMSTSPRPTVFITQRVPPGGPELLAPHCEISQYDSEDPIPRAELLKQVAGKDALFCLLTDKVDKELLDAAGPQLKVIGTMSVGFDHVDLKECAQRKVPVGYTPEVLTSAVAELTIALLLATSRRLKEGMDAVTSGAWGTWKPLWLLGQGLEGSTVGIAGMGRIGVALAERLRPFGVAKLLYSDVQPSPHAAALGAEHVPMDEMLKNSDFVLALCALTPETRGMFNRDVFKKMKNTAIFVNTSRGPVVNQDDLYEALKSGEIGAAGLDVTVPEPLPTDSPLLTLPNCIVLPHIASATKDTRNAMSKLTATNILAGLNKEPLPKQVPA